MADVFKYTSTRLFQAGEFGGWTTWGVAGAGNFTGICAIPDPFDPVVTLCQITQVSFSQPASGGPLIDYTIQQRRPDGRGLFFFVSTATVK